jgi:hypothetical protein
MEQSKTDVICLDFNQIKTAVARQFDGFGE